MISEFTQARLGDDFVTRELDRITVKGKTQPVRIFEVFCRASDPVPPEIAPRLELHERGMALYRQRRWRDALSTFGAACETFPKDKAFHLYTERCRHFLAQPPPRDWDGVWELKEK